MEVNARPGRARRSAAASLSLILLLVPVLAAQHKPLTLDEAVRLVLERNELSRSNQESVLAANARVQSARSFFFPAITSTSSYTRRAYEVRRLVGDSEVIISRYNALSETLVLLPAISHPSVELHQAYLDLGCDAVVMNISAHPDDEDGAALAFNRMQLGVKTYSVLFTRGEGGQNEKGPELYEDLAVLRSAETEAAGGILGAEVHFLNLRDFGYSKSATEAFRVWGGTEEPLRRLVWMIRKLRPDVLFTNHNTVGGHGHHHAAAVTALDAFDAGGDSMRFPDQVQQLGV